jgi:hypothetical protein
MAHTFLSEAWLDAARAIGEEAGAGTFPDGIEMNMVVVGGPDGDRELHVAGGSFGSGLREGAPTKLTIPYDVARGMFVDGNQSAAMQAFMSGQIKVEGDMSKLMAMQSHGASAAANGAAIQARLREITA